MHVEPTRSNPFPKIELFHPHLWQSALSYMFNGIPNPKAHYFRFDVPSQSTIKAY